MGFPLRVRDVKDYAHPDSGARPAFLWRLCRAAVVASPLRATHPSKNFMTSDEIVNKFNSHQPAVMQTLAARVLDLDLDAQTLRMQFDIGREFCHTVDVVQGGFVTAMLDASMAHVVMAVDGFGTRVSSIDINVSFLRPARAGRFVAVGGIVRLGRSIGFLKAELFNDKGELIATATSSAHLTRATA
jgi:uncharacterized protein (TIGR00369 family)